MGEDDRPDPTALPFWSRRVIIAGVALGGVATGWVRYAASDPMSLNIGRGLLVVAVVLGAMVGFCYMRWLNAQRREFDRSTKAAFRYAGAGLVLVALTRLLGPIAQMTVMAFAGGAVFVGALLMLDPRHRPPKRPDVPL